MNIQDISSEFLYCLQIYRKNLLLSKAFYAWKNIHNQYIKNINIIIKARKIQKSNLTKKCFEYLKHLTKVHNPIKKNFKCIRYLIYFLGISLFTKDKWNRSKNHFDKIVFSLFQLKGSNGIKNTKIKFIIRKWHESLKRKTLRALDIRRKQIMAFKVYSKKAHMKKYFHKFREVCMDSKLYKKTQYLIKKLNFAKFIRNITKMMSNHKKKQIGVKFLTKKIQGKYFTAWEKIYSIQTSNEINHQKAINYIKKKYRKKIFNMLKTAIHIKIKNKTNKKTFYHKKLYNILKAYFDNWKHFINKRKTHRSQLNLIISTIKTELLSKYFQEWMNSAVLNHIIRNFRRKWCLKNGLNLLIRWSLSLKSLILILYSRKWLKNQRKQALYTNHFSRLLRILRLHYESWKFYIFLKKEKIQKEEYAIKWRHALLLKNIFLFWKKYSSKKTKIAKSNIIIAKNMIHRWFLHFRSNIQEILNIKKKVATVDIYLNQKLLAKIFKCLVLNQKKNYDINLIALKFYTKAQLLKIFFALRNYAKKKVKNKTLKTKFWDYLVEKRKKSIWKSWCILENKNKVKRKQQKLAILTYKAMIGRAFFNFLKKKALLSKISSYYSDKLQFDNLRACFEVWWSSLNEAKLFIHVSKILRTNRLKRILSSWINFIFEKKRYAMIIETLAKKKRAKLLESIFYSLKSLLQHNNKKKYCEDTILIKHIKIRLLNKSFKSWKILIQKFKLLTINNLSYEEKSTRKLLYKYWQAMLNSTKKIRSLVNIFNQYIQIKNKKYLRKCLNLFINYIKYKQRKKHFYKIYIKSQLTRAFRGWIVGMKIKKLAYNFARKKEVERLYKMVKIIYDNWASYTKKYNNIRRALVSYTSLKKQNKLKFYFQNWKVNYEEIHFLNESKMLIDKHMKIKAFRKFQNAVIAYKKMKEYKEKLEGISSGFYRTKGIKQFYTCLVRNANIRKYNLALGNIALGHYKSSAFNRFKTKLSAGIQKTRKNLASMKCYALSLYSACFTRWRYYTIKKKLLRQRFKPFLIKRVHEYLKKNFFAWNFAQKQAYLNNLRLSRENACIANLQKLLVAKGLKNLAASLKSKSPKIKNQLDEYFAYKILDKAFHKWAKVISNQIKARNMLNLIMKKILKKRISECYERIKMKYKRKKKNEAIFIYLGEKYIIKLMNTNFMLWKNLYRERINEFSRQEHQDISFQDQKSIKLVKLISQN